jgi:hypothetical protein
MRNANIESITYIIDNESAPFIDDILKIEEVYSSCGEELPINDPTNCDSVYTTSFRTLQVPCEIRKKTSVLSVLYRADHQAIPLHVDPETVEVELGAGHLEALLLYVASRVYASNPSLAQSNEPMMFLQRFEGACAKINELGLISKEDPTNTKLEIRGWL